MSRGGSPRLTPAAPAITFPILRLPTVNKLVSRAALAAIALMPFLLMAILASPAHAAKRPNFVWLLSEDNSKHYLKFDEHGAPAPNIEALAREGIVFERAFSNSPVCSVARTTLQTGCYGPRIGTQFHRKSKPATLPNGLRMFPYYLRQAGYYTTNNSKKDYNAVEGKGVWDESSRRATWRNRPTRETPFFHMQSFGMSHESSLHFKAAEFKRSPSKPKSGEVFVAPYHPDTPLFRFTYARYHDRMAAIDQAIGKIVSQLKEDGLLDDTFIFYFGDHGGVLPRSKGYLYESGLHVPLVVRVPKNFRELSPGSRTKGFVSFIDFGPTLLNLAGLEVPKPMDGRPFLGRGATTESLAQRHEAFGYADRFDEKYDLVRSLRKGRYKYIRNYEAFLPDGLQNNYRYRMLAHQQWRELYRQGKLNAAQRQFFESKPVEALYDLEKDPYEVKNLAGDPAHAEKLAELRGRLQSWVKGMPDLSFYPESHLVKHGLDAPVEFGRKHAPEIARLVETADLSLLPFEKARPKLQRALQSSNRWERYWAVTAASCFGKEAAPLAAAIKERLEDPERLVRVRAAEFLAIAVGEDPRPTLYRALSEIESPVEGLIILNTAAFLNDRNPSHRFNVNKAQFKTKGGQMGRRLDYLK